MTWPRRLRNQFPFRRLPTAAGVNHSTTTIILHTSTGEELRTYVNAEGAFAFHDVPSGVQLLQPFNLHLVYPEVRGGAGRGEG